MHFRFFVFSVFFYARQMIIESKYLLVPHIYIQKLPWLPFLPGIFCKVLEKGGPYPQVILPQFGGYWIEDVEATVGTPSSSESSFCEDDDGEEGLSPGGGHSYRLECNSIARAYRKHFLGKVSVCVLSLVFTCKFCVVFDMGSLSFPSVSCARASRNTWTITAPAAA